MTYFTYSLPEAWQGLAHPVHHSAWGKVILVELDKLYIFLRHILLLSFHYQEKENDDNPKSDNCSSCKKAKVNLCEADDSDMAEVVERRSRSGKN